MKNYKETDQIIKDRLGQYDSGAPMHLFDRIEEGLDDGPQRKKRGGGWWLTLGLLLLLAGGASWYAISNSSTETSNNVTTVEENTSTLTSPRANHQSKQEGIKTKTTTLATNTTTTKKENLTTDLTVEKVSVAKTFKGTATEKIANNNFVEKVNHSVNTNSKEEELVSNTQQHTANIFFSKGKKSTTAPLTKEVKEQSVSIITARQEVPALVDLNVKYDSQFQLPDFVKCGDKKDRRLNLNGTTSMDLFVSPERSFRFLEYKANDYAEYATRRNETEKAYYSFSSGIRLNYLTTNGLAIRTGLVYSQINEIFEEQFLETRILTDPTNGDTLGFSQFLNDVTTFNRYKMVDIPLMIGYELPMKRSTINVNAGIFVNVKATQKGNMLDVEETKRDFTTGTGEYDVFRKNIGVSYFMSLGAAYELSPRYQFFFEPHLRYYPGSFTTKEYVLNQKYITGGILLGIRKKL